MLSILGHERFAGTEGLAMDAPSVEDLRRNDALTPTEDYEYVLGRRQVASLSFVVLVLISVFAGIAYLAGRAEIVRANNRPVTIEGAPGHPTVITPVSHEVPAPPPLKPAAQAAVPAVPQGDVFGDPVSGAIYIQTAATDKGIARVMAEGIRTHALPAIVAPGPNEKIFRVLVGPFPNMPAYQKAKDMLDGIGVTAFARFQK